MSSGRDKKYVVEIRSLSEKINSCDCADFSSNGLGTCKHIEHIIFCLKKGDESGFEQARNDGNPRTEIFLDNCDSGKFGNYSDSVDSGDASNSGIYIYWPKEIDSTLYKYLDTFFSATGMLLGRPVSTYPVLVDFINNNKDLFKSPLRISLHIDHALEYMRLRHAKRSAKEMFLEDLRSGKKTLDVIKHPLYHYQKEGIIHLVFGERALLADEMGLSKTV